MAMYAGSSCARDILSQGRSRGRSSAPLKNRAFAARANDGPISDLVRDILGNLDADNVRPNQKLIPSKMTGVAANYHIQHRMG
jgi:hypothetical protein